MNTQERASTIVIGAGINGVSAAIWLARAGRQVTLIDRQAPGEGTSHGNAGVLASCSVVPVTTPGLLRKAPGMLMDPDFPLFLRWSYLPRLLPWLSGYIAHANDADTRRIASSLRYMLADSLQQHQDLAGNTAADRWLVPSHYQFAYADRQAFEADCYVWNLRRENGFEPQILEGGLVQEKEPALGKGIGLLAVMRDGHGHVRSPGGYVKSLAEVFQGMGGRIVQAEVKDLELQADRLQAVQTTEGRFACDTAVLATGVWSGPLARKLGIRVPMESERGYHVIFRDPSQNVSVPTMIASGKFVATPMEEGMRCAGIVEFGGLHKAASRKPIELLMRQMKALMPDLQYSETVEWMGHRPAPTDSLPFIGQIRATGIHTAFGHQHVGLTGGAKTGRLVAGLICGEQDPQELTAFSPHRY